MKKKSLTISSEKVIRQIPFEDIVYMKSNGMFTVMHTSSKEKHGCSKNLGEIVKQLDESKLFFRVHNSHIVNLEKIKMYKKEKGGKIVMVDGAKIPVSRRKKSGFLRKYNGEKGT